MQPNPVIQKGDRNVYTGGSKGAVPSHHFPSYLLFFFFLSFTFYVQVFPSKRVGDKKKGRTTVLWVPLCS
jgi:hypothetical protein